MRTYVRRKTTWIFDFVNGAIRSRIDAALKVVKSAVAGYFQVDWKISELPEKLRRATRIKLPYPALAKISVKVRAIVLTGKLTGGGLVKSTSSDGATYCIVIKTVSVRENWTTKSWIVGRPLGIRPAII